MYIICTYLTSYLSHLAQGTDLTEIARLGPKVSEEWAATHLLHSNCSTILTIIGRYIGVISLDTEKVGMLFGILTCFLFKFPLRTSSWANVQTTELIATIKWRICVDFGNTWTVAASGDFSGVNWKKFRRLVWRMKQWMNQQNTSPTG